MSDIAVEVINVNPDLCATSTPVAEGKITAAQVYGECPAELEDLCQPGCG
jgi:hypothetical protein